ncbi:MAG: NADH-quinone oxidoreductase subunit A [Saprospiraceae bacterium]|nr:NADH-quinone oxidoreductase subunit A [Saprospiraceae bacterium]MCB9326812.1 NADH-quinone oxidoreductase subunit A [Lewinellaceae bacterium]
MGLEAIIVFLVAGVVFVGGAMAASALLAPNSKNEFKNDPYECGLPTEGPTHVQFKVGYYLFAILFLVFDVEMVFLVPWAVVMKSIGGVALVEALIFLIILGMGLLYAWKKKALVWE